MKRFITILLVVGMLFCFTSCDDMSPLTDFMAQMGQNVLGMSTAGADEADNLISGLASSQNDIETKTETSDGTKVEEGKVVATNKVGDIQLEVQIPEKHKTTLPKLEEKQKEDLVTSIGKATQNEESKKAFDEKMSKPAEEKAAKATQGSAAMASATATAVLEQVKKATPPAEGEPAAPALPKEVETTLNSLTAQINKFAEKPAEEVTQADVAIIQLVDSFINTTVKATTEVKTTGEGAEAKSEIVAKEMTEADQKALIDEAATLYTAVNTLSSASSIDITAALDLANSLQGKTEPAARSLSTRGGEAAPEVTEEKYLVLPVEVPETVLPYINTVYEALAPAFATKSADKVIYEFSISKIAYETYMLNADVRTITDKSNDEFNSLNNFLKYVITSALVEAESLLDDILEDQDAIALLSEYYIDAAKVKTDFRDPAKNTYFTLWDLLEEVYNSTFKGKTSVTEIKIPAKYFVKDTTDEMLMDKFSKDNAKALADFFSDQSENASLAQVIDVVEKLADVFAKDLLPESVDFNKVREALNMPVKGGAV